MSHLLFKGSVCLSPRMAPSSDRRSMFVVVTSGYWRDVDVHRAVQGDVHVDVLLASSVCHWSISPQDGAKETIHTVKDRTEKAGAKKPKKTKSDICTVYTN